MYIKKENSSGITTWTIIRPDRGNGLGLSIAKELLNNLKEMKKKFDNLYNHNLPSSKMPARVLILKAELCGKAKNIWIAGGDLKELSLLSTNEEAMVYAQTMSNVCDLLEQLPIPTIAAINGLAIGGGAELALACDLRLLSKDAGFSFKQLKIGLSTGYASISRIASAVGLSRAKNILFQCKTINAPEALLDGLASEVFDSHEELNEKTDQIAQTLLNLEPQALAAQKELFNLAYQNEHASIKEEELFIFKKLWKNPTHKKFIEGFIQNK